MFQIKLKRYFRTFAFLRLLLIVNFSSFLIYFVLLVINTYRFPNSNYHASVIRDQEELRLAHLRSLIYDWQVSGKLPLTYKSSFSHYFRSSPFTVNKYSITIGILTSSRSQHRIDDYQTYYLTESVATLVRLIFQDISNYGYRFKFINIVVCTGNADKSKTIPSLNEIIRLVGENSIYTLSTDEGQSNLNLSLGCQTVKFTSKCMLEIVKRTRTQVNDYILIMQEDMIPEDNLFDVLWEILHQSITDNQTLGMIQLYSRDNVLKFPFHHKTDKKIFEFSFGFILLCVLLTFTRFTARPFFAMYNMLLFLCVFITLSIVICMYGMNNLSIRLHNLLFSSHTVFHLRGQAYYAQADRTMASLYPAEQLKYIGYYLNSAAPCSHFVQNLKQGESRLSQLITSYLVSNVKLLFSVCTNVFKHHGLYAYEENRMLDPTDVEQ
uniref:Uncharacterized protein n=1 Tax=Trichobilharzia regenti TaxID=157069 RepID=A0AA85KEW8_TRIRE|nr:unnamed protein product [Trichobilharzia regenti]